MLLKRDLIGKLADKGYTKVAANLIWKDVVEVLEEALVSGEDIRFMGFGDLVVREMGPRKSKHPATKEEIIIPAHKTVRFLPGRRMKEELANGFIRG